MMKEMLKETMLEDTWGAKEIRWSSWKKIKKHWITIEYQWFGPQEDTILIHNALDGGYEEKIISIIKTKYWIHILFKTKKKNFLTWPCHHEVHVINFMSYHVMGHHVPHYFMDYVNYILEKCKVNWELMSHPCNVKTHGGSCKAIEIQMAMMVI